MNKLDHLPQAILTDVFSRLTAQDRFSFSICCKRLNRIFRSHPELWRGYMYEIEMRKPYGVTGCHSIAVIDNGTDPLELVIHGGNIIDFHTGYISQCYNQLAKCDFVKREWIVMNPDDHRPPTTESVMIHYKDRLYTIAGTGQLLSLVTNKVFRYDLPLSEEKVFTEIKTDYSDFFERSAHTAVRHQDKLYIYGGWDGLDDYNDVLVFDLENEEFRKIRATYRTSIEDIPCPRRKHICTIYNNGMYVFGGYCEKKDQSSFNSVYRLDLGDHLWERVKCWGDVPCGRSRCEAARRGNTWYMVGGWDRSVCFNDFYQLNLGQISNETSKSSDVLVYLSFCFQIL
eukprot:TRINITY_DN1306_c0_g1_i1.p1 TRINITY_DN1306_c0_g1~~TRINITY_DN1306_c0_g1_i1.p1  ORF type:complete len:342 (-),score=54.80 TRINITY_DN1306_c0_g1_i1:171-1196(-)